MPNYMKKALKQFQHIAGKLQHSPYTSMPIQYGTKKQYATQELTAGVKITFRSNANIISKKRKKLFLEERKSQKASIFSSFNWR